MAGDINWIVDALARDRTKTQKGLADALGIDQSAISRMKNGARQLKYTEAQKAASYLGVSPPAGLAEDGEAYEHEPAAQRSGGALVSIYNAEPGGNGFWRLDRAGGPADRRPRPGALTGGVRVFGFYAPDAAMAPRFKIGEVVWVDSIRPAAPREDALLIENTRRKGLQKIFLCELLDIQDADFLTLQHGGGEPQYFPRKNWTALHVLPRL